MQRAVALAQAPASDGARSVCVCTATGADLMAEPPDTRRAPRIKVGLEVYYSSTREEGPAVLADVSSVGALLEQTQVRPRVGAKVGMTVFLPNGNERLQVDGQVIRHTEAGFAIEFERPSPHVYELLVEDAASVTSVEESDRGDVPTLEEVGGSGSQDELGMADEAGLAPFLRALEMILQAALDGRRGSVEPDEALDIIIDRVRELDKDAGRTRP